MQNPNGFRTVLLLTPPLFLLLPLSCLIFIFERISRTLLYAQTIRSWRYGDQTITLYGPNSTSSNPDSYDYTDVELRINDAPTAAILGVCVVAFVVSVLGVCGIWELRRVEGRARHQRVWSWITLVSNFLVVALSVAVLAWASAVQGAEKGWTGYQDVGKGQRFTRETWVCSIDRLYPQQDWAGPACGLAKATRFMLIPLAIAAVLVMFCAWILTRDRGGASWLVGGKGRYGGFQSAYEMNPSQPQPGPGPVPYFQPAPQFYPMPQQYPPAPVGPAPQVTKDATTTGDRVVFR